MSSTRGHRRPRIRSSYRAPASEPSEKLCISSRAPICSAYQAGTRDEKRSGRRLTLTTAGRGRWFEPRRVNAMVRGWANYFKHGVSKRTFSYLDS